MLKHLDDDALITEAQLLDDAGGISTMTRYRWEKRYDDFPDPIYIAGRRFYRVGAWRQFKENRAAEAPPRARGAAASRQAAA